MVSPPKRIPSPRELQQHTQTIMQTALIRKKLQEQTENFRRRQEQMLKEQHHSGGPKGNSDVMNNNPHKIASPIPALAFTPTSVLRKMTASGGGGGGNQQIQQQHSGGSPASPLPQHQQMMMDIKMPTPQQPPANVGIVINNGEDLLRLKQCEYGNGVGIVF